MALVLEDNFGRAHDDLRLSITDRCNLRCAYCMPEQPEWFPRREILSYEEALYLVRIFLRRGVRRVRLTGGEPLARRDLAQFVRMLADEPGLEDLSLTTNGLLLAPMADALAAAGLCRVNVSLDTLRADRYARMTRRDVLDRVLLGLEHAVRAGLKPLKVNTVLMRGENEDEVEPLVEHGILRRSSAERMFGDGSSACGRSSSTRTTTRPRRRHDSGFATAKARSDSSTR
jgi:cyclic pyranopterin phosphate synthase